MKRNNEGFSLIELLIVIAIILILVAIAIPNFQKIMINGRETSAIGSIRAINNAQIMYQQSYPQQGFACTLATLGTQAGAQAGPQSSGLLTDTQLLNGVKDGYIFTLTCNRAQGQGSGETAGQNATATSYLIVASPVTPGKTGNRFFCSDQPGSIHYSMNANCNPDSDPTT
ncbi:MAG: prepilin-type N-terminal cleavage/methylation domain-containing protein [Acidobacteriales bacterium]|nr:prepilin-type N-terminal cleavage/methylation domain-containing protein [Terriglobales bacterium]